MPCPNIKIEEVTKGGGFKKRIQWIQLRCDLCGMIVLGRGVTSSRDWEIIRRHNKYVHKIEEDEGIPVRLLSTGQFSLWLKKEKLKISSYRSKTQ